MFRYYDRDHSGDLNLAELGLLLEAAGMGCMTPREVVDACAEYDADEDEVLDAAEATAMLRDVWRLVVASRWKASAGVWVQPLDGAG